MEGKGLGLRACLFSERTCVKNKGNNGKDQQNMGKMAMRECRAEWPWPERAGL